MSDSPQLRPAPGRLGPLEVILLLALVVVARVVVGQYLHIYDDAFITYRYARNWATGLGLVFNPGMEWEPVLGTTTPGYTAILALLHSLGLDLVRASLGWNLVMDVVSALLLLRLGDFRRSLAGLAVVGFALSPELVRISVGGMEASTLIALVLGTCLSLRSGRHLQAGLLAALCCTIRPEAVLFVLVCGVGLLRDRRAALRYALPVVLIGVVYAAALWSYFGSPIPNSVRSKAERHSGSPLLRSWMDILQQGLLPRPAYVVFLPFVLLGARRMLSRECTLRPMLLFGASILAAYLAARPHTWGWYYAIPLLAWVTSAAHGIHHLLLPRLGERRFELLFRFGLPVTVLGAVVFGLTATPLDPVTERVYRPLQAWAQEEGLDGLEHTILASDIGAVAYYASGTVLDTEGLTWPLAEPSGDQVPKILEYEPDYLFITAVELKLGKLLEAPEAYAAYEPVQRFSVSGDGELRPEADGLPLIWRQDYILFERRESGESQATGAGD